jgi:hypothetical protein
MGSHFLVGESDGDGFARGAGFIGEKFSYSLAVGGIDKRPVDSIGGKDDKSAGA